MQIKIKTVRDFPKRKLSQKGNKLKKSEKIIKNVEKLPFLEIDPIKIALLGNNPDQKYFYMLENSEKIWKNSKNCLKNSRSTRTSQKQ